MKLFYAAVAAALLSVQPAISDETIDHYAGEPAETLEQALANLSDYNGRLGQILAQGSLSTNDMEDIHQLTYTLEVALAKLNAEGAALAETLEQVHLASEGSDVPALRAVASEYLATAQQIVP